MPADIYSNQAMFITLIMKIIRLWSSTHVFKGAKDCGMKEKCHVITNLSGFEF